MELIIFPLVFLFFFLAIGAGIVFVVIQNFKKRGARINGFQSLAAQWGFDYVGDVTDDSIPHRKHFYLFNLGDDEFDREVKYLMRGTANNFRVSVFEFWYVFGNNQKIELLGTGMRRKRIGEGHTVVHKMQTVVMLESLELNLPLFAMRPESGGLFQKIGEIFGGQDIDFPSHPVFSGKYLLRGSNEAHIRHVFTAPVLSYFESSPVFCVEGGGSQLFIYNFNERVPLERMHSMVDSALKTAAQFTRQ